MPASMPTGSAGRQRGMGRYPSRYAGDAAALLAGLGAGITLAVTIPVVVATPWTTPGALANVFGILTAMLGTYAALLCIVLMARLPWLEREVGQDRLTAWHRQLGPWTLVLIVMHVVLTTWGYGQLTNASWLDELISLTFSTAWMLPALAATMLMIGLGVISWRRIRSQMKYETWHIAHLYFYLAVALAFGHQLGSGSVFLHDSLATTWWVGLYLAILAAIVYFRIVVPILRSVRFDIRVSRVVRVDGQTTHVYMSGRQLERLDARGGQWFSFRFATRQWWWQGHPYSLSAAPTSTMMRITVKDLGDHSASLAALKRGTRVFFEGPYGAFRLDRASYNKIALICAGVGVTPIRALLDELPRDMQATVIYRVHETPAVLADELRKIADSSHGRIALQLLVGSRAKHPMDARMLHALLPAIQSSDVFICGPTGFVDIVRSSIQQLGVPTEHIHDELFEF